MLDQLGRDLKQLQVDYERFFNGALPTPPEELRNRIQTQLRQQLLNEGVGVGIDHGVSAGRPEFRMYTGRELAGGRCSSGACAPQ